MPASSASRVSNLTVPSAGGMPFCSHSLPTPRCGLRLEGRSTSSLRSCDLLCVREDQRSCSSCVGRSEEDPHTGRCAWCLLMLPHSPAIIFSRLSRQYRICLAAPAYLFLLPSSSYHVGPPSRSSVVGPKRCHRQHPGLGTSATAFLFGISRCLCAIVEANRLETI